MTHVHEKQHHEQGLADRNRERDRRNRLRMPAHLELGNFPAAHGAMNREGGGEGSSLSAYIASQWDPGLTWKDVEWLRSISPLPVVVKGVLAPDDAVLSIEHGASAVIVSNHGARQLDTVPASISPRARLSSSAPRESNTRAWAA